jgi:hypothetical protein
VGCDRVLGSLRVLGSSPSVRAMNYLESKPDRFRHRFEIEWSGKLLGLRVHLLSAITLQCDVSDAGAGCACKTAGL